MNTITPRDPRQTGTPVLAGHRGYPLRYPENTLVGYRAAIEVGASMVECDVQFTRDRVPVVLHDAGFERTAGINSEVFELEHADLSGISVHEQARFGEEFMPTPVPDLAELLQMIAAAEGVTLLVEIKSESIEHHGLQAVMPVLLDVLLPYAEHVIVISLHAGSLQWLRDHSELQIGWVFERWDDDNREVAQTMQPELLLCHQRLVTADTELWSGAWQWMLYGVEDIELARSLCARGIQFIETDDIGGLIAAASDSGTGTMPDRSDDQ